MELKDLIEATSSSNSGYETATALSIRLDTRQTIQDIENFLRGREENFYLNKETGRTVAHLDKLGKKCANEEGIRNILNFCRSMINTQVVQGNYEKKAYIEFIIEKRIELAERLLTNLYEWELQTEDHVNIITDFIMNLVEPYLSRTIDNKERDSYDKTLQMKESHVSSEGKRGLLG